METKVRVREIWRCYAAGFEDGEKGHALRKQRVLLKAGEGQAKDFAPQVPKP